MKRATNRHPKMTTASAPRTAYVEPAETVYRLCVAPMMAWTDRHCRFLHRLLAPSARLYTEMVSTDALLHGNAKRLLAFDPAERPVGLQIGGNEPSDLAKAAGLAERAGFDEINLNVGCPSERVQRGAIGACLMRQPSRVAAGVAAMRDAATIPVTVKCRLGVMDTATSPSDTNDFGELRDFVGEVADAGVHVFVVHARKAVLNGLTPAQNRAIPPLRPDLVARLAQEMPRLTIILNGGIRDTDTARRHLDWAAGVMVGRAAYRDPVWLSHLNAELFGGQPATAEAAFDAYLPYVGRQLKQGARLHDMTRHMLTIFNGRPGARLYRRFLSAHDTETAADTSTLQRAADFVLRRGGAAALCA